MRSRSRGHLAVKLSVQGHSVTEEANTRDCSSKIPETELIERALVLVVIDWRSRELRTPISIFCGHVCSETNWREGPYEHGLCILA